MEITFEQSAICPHCVKGGMNTQTAIRVSTDNANLLRCGSCGWVLPESIKLTVPEGLEHLMRCFLERCNMHMESPLRQHAPWDLRRAQEADTFVRLQTVKRDVFCQLIWRQVTNPLDISVYLDEAELATSWQSYVDEAPADTARVLQVLIDEGFSVKGPPSNYVRGSQRVHCTFYKHLEGSGLMVHAEMSWGDQDSATAPGRQPAHPLW